MAILHGAASCANIAEVAVLDRLSLGAHEFVRLAPTAKRPGVYLFCYLVCSPHGDLKRHLGVPAGTRTHTCPGAPGFDIIGQLLSHDIAQALVRFWTKSGGKAFDRKNPWQPNGIGDPHPFSL